MIVDANIQTSKGGISDSEIALLTEQIDKLEAPYVLVQEFLVLTLSEDGTYYIVGDNSETDGNALKDTYNGEDILIPSKYKGIPIKTISKYAFANVSNLTHIIIPDEVTSIGNKVFYNCSGLTSVTIGNGVTSIGESAFNGCRRLTSITIPNSVTSIGESAFQDCTNLTSITIPDNVISIKNSTFSGCSKLTKVNISDIEKFASISFGTSNANPLYFAKNLYLNDVLVTDINLNIESISAYAFYNATCLTSVTLSENVKSIGISAFNGCTGLTSVTIGNGVTSIGESAFNGCTGLTSIVVESGNRVYDSRNNCNAIIETATNTLIKGCNTTVIPDSVTSIGDKAFYKCTSLTSITIPTNTNFIGKSAFGSSGLTTITFNHTQSDIITLPNSGSSTGMLYNKTAKNITVYHNNNATVLGYNYKADNITPTFVQL